MIRRSLRALAVTLSALLLGTGTGTATADPAQATKYHEVLAVFTSCTNELIELQGTFHTVTKEDADGGTRHKTTFHGQGVGSEGNDYVITVRELIVAQDGSVRGDLTIRMITAGSAVDEVSELSFLSTPDREEFSMSIRCH